MSPLISSSAILLRKKWLDALGGLPDPVVKNSEWLYMLEEETRNSLMIEGHFVTKAQLQNALTENPKRKAVPEITGAFEAANFAYEFAYQQWQEKEFTMSKASIRALHALLFKSVPDFPYQKGNYRQGNIIIAGAGFVSPDYTRIPELLEKILWASKKHKNWHPWRRAAFFHAFFENLHPFPDGNGRIGRILANWILLAHGFPNIAIRYDKKEQYFSALEAADSEIADVFTGKRAWGKFQVKCLIELERLFIEQLAEVFDYIIINRSENRGFQMLPIREVAEKAGQNHNSLKVAASRKQIIAIQKNGKWFSHPMLLQIPQTPITG